MGRYGPEKGVCTIFLVDSLIVYTFESIESTCSRFSEYKIINFNV